jgi:hypothetical protein
VSKQERTRDFVPRFIGNQQISYQSHFRANLSLSPRQQALKFGKRIASII